MSASAQLAPGHTDSVLCCEVLGAKRLLASGGEDGTVCFIDLTSSQPVGRVTQRHGDAVPALCCHPGEDHTLFAAAGPAVLQLDLRSGMGAEAVVRTFTVNQDEVNGLAVSTANGGWLAAGDDSGEVQVISLQGLSADPAAAGAQGTAQGPATAGVQAAAPAARPTYKTLRRGHSNIVSCVAFRQHRPWEVLSGGLDSTVVKWDFSRLRPLQAWSLSGEATASGGQLFNPPMVHSIAVPQTEDRTLCRVLAVGRGDGCVSLYDADHKPLAAASSGSGGGKKGSGKTKGKAKGSSTAAQQQQQQQAGVPGRLALLGREQGGHTAAVNCVSFFAGSSWRQLLSGGNDCRLLLWNWQTAAAAGEEAAEAAEEASEGEACSAGSGALRQGGMHAAAAGDEVQAAGSSSSAGVGSGGAGAQQLLAAERKHPRKINWVCSAEVANCNHDTFVADTGRRITALTLAQA